MIDINIFNEWKNYVQNDANYKMGGVDYGLIYWIDNILPKINGGKLPLLPKNYKQYTAWINHFDRTLILNSKITAIYNYYDSIKSIKIVGKKNMKDPVEVERNNLKQEVIRLNSKIMRLEKQIASIKHNNNFGLLNAFVSGANKNNANLSQDYIYFLKDLLESELIDIGDVYNGEISVKWSIGGASGGDCWGSEAEYSAIREDEPDFTKFENIIQKFNPNINFLKFKNLQKDLVKTREDYENGYYGNYTEYMIKYVLLEDLYKYNKEGKIRG